MAENSRRLPRHMNSSEEALIAWLNAHLDTGCSCANGCPSVSIPSLQRVASFVRRSWACECVRGVVDAMLVAALQRPHERDAALRLLAHLPVEGHSTALVQQLLEMPELGIKPLVVRNMVIDEGEHSALYDGVGAFERLWEYCRRRPQPGSVLLLCQLLPGFVAKYTEQLRELCGSWHEIRCEPGFAGSDVRGALHTALAHRYPEHFVVHNSAATAARDEVLCAFYAKRAALSPPPMHAHVAASMVYAQMRHSSTVECRQWAGMLPQCVVARACCCWSRALVDHLACLRPRTGHGALQSLFLTLQRSAQFDAVVRLVAAGVGVCSIAYDGCLDGGLMLPDYTAGDIAHALAPLPQRDATSRCSPQREHLLDPARTMLYLTHVQWLSTSHWPRSLGCRYYPRALPQWTPDTHHALYRHATELHTIMLALFMLHETRAASPLAALPYELLFAVMDCVRIGYCEARS